VIFIVACRPFLVGKEENIMLASIIVAAISAAASIIAAAVSYFMTKSKEREADWRKQKLEHYRELLEAISGIVEGDATPESQRRYAKATNVIGLVASQDVIIAMERTRRASKRHAGWTVEEHDAALSALVLAIRRDLDVRPKDDPSTFRYKLWASGTGSAPVGDQ
jgi:hypothetical protein